MGGHKIRELRWVNSEFRPFTIYRSSEISACIGVYRRLSAARMLALLCRDRLWRAFAGGAMT